MALDQLLADIGAGRKYMKVYKQMKMYNDPALNPVLYGKNNGKGISNTTLGYRRCRYDSACHLFCRQS